MGSQGLKVSRSQGLKVSRSQGLSKASQKSLKSLSKASQKSLKSLSKASQKPLKRLSKASQKSLKSRSKVSQKPLKSRSKVSQKSLKSRSKASQKIVSWPRQTDRQCQLLSCPGQLKGYSYHPSSLMNPSLYILQILFLRFERNTLSPILVQCQAPSRCCFYKRKI